MTDLAIQAAQNIIRRTRSRRNAVVLSVLQNIMDDTMVAVTVEGEERILLMSYYVFNEELKRITPDSMAEAFNVALANRAREQRATLPSMTALFIFHTIVDAYRFQDVIPAGLDFRFHDSDSYRHPSISIVRDEETAEKFDEALARLMRLGIRFRLTYQQNDVLGS